MIIDLIVLKTIAALLSQGFLLNAWICRKVVGTWLNPSSIFSLFWYLYSFLPLLIAFEAPINPLGITYILCFSVFFSSSIILFNWDKALRQNAIKPSSDYLFNTNLLRYIFYFISLVSINSILIGISQSASMNLLSFISDPLGFAAEYAGKSYGGKLQESLFSTIGIASGYVTAIIGGLLFGSSKKKSIAVIAFIPQIITLLLMTIKGQLLLSLFLFIGGILICRVYDNSLYLLSKKEIIRLSFLSVLFFPLLLMSFLSRGLSEETNLNIIFERIYSNLVSYSSGHLYAFSSWLEDRYLGYSGLSYAQQEFQLGFYSLMSFFKFFDTRELPIGIYEEYFSYGGYLETNVYTVFRGIITDYSLLGSMFIAVLIGFFSNFFFYRLLIERLRSFYILFFIYFVGIAYQSFVISTLTWITIPSTFLLLCLILYSYFKILAK